MDLNRHTLANGLRIVHSYEPYTAMVAVDVLYNVGARDESRDHTGIAHLFEHLMFGGSANAPSFDGILEEAGGTSNAWTNADFTNFYETLPACNLDTALFLESDRMLAPSLGEQSLRVQRAVVIEEFKQQCLDRPYGTLMHRLRALAYDAAHPYSWPVIGLEPEHIAGVTEEEARRWFNHHYAPNNAVLAVAGNVDFDTVCRRAEHWFADVPARAIAPRVLPNPGFPRADVVETVPCAEPVPLIVMAFPMDVHGTPGYYAADTITDILSVGRAARLTANVVNGVGRGLIADADASIIGSEGPGLLLVTAGLSSSTQADIDRACQIIRAELHKLTVPGEVSDYELERTLNTFEATFRFGNTGYAARAANIAMAEMQGLDINATVTDRRRLTPADITATARTVFAETPSVTVIFKPDEEARKQHS